MRPELVNMKGGPKHKWYEDHQPEVLQFYHLHGKDETMQEFGIRRESTLNSIINMKPRWKLDEQEKRIDRLQDRVLQAEERLRIYRHEQIDLTEQYQAFVPAISEQITEKFIKPLFSLVIKLPPALEEKGDRQERVVSQIYQRLVEKETTRED